MIFIGLFCIIAGLVWLVTSYWILHNGAMLDKDWQIEALITSTFGAVFTVLGILILCQ